MILNHYLAQPIKVKLKPYVWQWWLDTHGRYLSLGQFYGLKSTYSTIHIYLSSRMGLWDL